MSKFILIILGLISLNFYSFSQTDYCYTNYMYAAYFFPAYNNVHCLSGDFVKVKNKSFSAGDKGLKERLVNKMKSKGYQLIANGDREHGTKLPNIFVKNLPKFKRYCQLIESETKPKLSCPIIDGKILSGNGFSIEMNNVNEMINFIKEKGFQLIEEIPQPPKRIDKHQGRKITLFGSHETQDLCDLEALQPPFYMYCASQGRGYWFKK